MFFLPETAVFTEQWEVLDIGLDQSTLQTESTPQLISKHEVLPLYRMREKFSNKFSYGHAVIIGGSYGKMGSVVLSSKAVLKTGCGLITAYIPSCGASILQSSFPEAMVQVGHGENVITDIYLKGQFNAVGIGVGMGTEKETVVGFTSFLKDNTLPLVVDADGVNMLSEDKDLLKLLPKETILTPHKSELERLIGQWENDFDMLNKVKVFSSTHNCIIVIKDAVTLTVYKNQVYVNTSGNPALATAGSGDVLTGMITSLIAQGYSNLQAAIVAVYLHGRTADVSIEETGYQSFIASDSVNNIGKAYLDMFKQPEPPVAPEV